MRIKSICLFLIGLVPFSYSQSILSVSPSNGFSGDYVTLQVRTQDAHFENPGNVYFQLKQGSFSQIHSASQPLNDSTFEVDFFLPHDFPLGYYDLILTYPNYPANIELLKLDAFQVINDPTPPSVVSVNPASLNKGSIAVIDVLTVNTHYSVPNFISAFLIHDQDTIPLYKYAHVFSQTHLILTFLIPFSFDVGDYDVILYSQQDGKLILQNAVTIIENPNPAYLVSCSPNELTQGGDAEILLTGFNTTFVLFNSFDLNVILRKQDNHEIASDWDHYNIFMQVTRINNTLLSAEFSLKYLLPPGNYDLFTVDPVNDTLFVPGGLVILPGPESPEIISVQPAIIYPKEPNGELNLLDTVKLIIRNSHFDATNMCRYIIYADHFLRLPPNYQIYYYRFINDSCIELDIGPFRIPTGTYNIYIGNQIENLTYYSAFHVDNPTYGIPDNKRVEEIISPNPTTDKVTITFMEPLTETIELQIANPMGQIIRKQQIEKGSALCSIHLSGNPKGVYLFIFSGKSKKNIKKVILL